MKKQN